MHSLTFQRATIKDCDTLCKIELRCFQKDGFNKQQFRYLLQKAKAITFIAYWDKKIAGYGMLLLPRHPKPARLYSMAILPEYQGKGIASNLLKYLIKISRKHYYSEIRLEVSVTNQKAVNLYHAIGFVEIEFLPSYYQDKTDGVRMKYQLSNTQDQ
ncbi:MAG: GNAT family N-acetyltransferase [Gammaproteobacteria bacterium]